jgi:hypothetical protein
VRQPTPTAALRGFEMRTAGENSSFAERTGFMIVSGVTARTSSAISVTLAVYLLLSQYRLMGFANMGYVVGVVVALFTLRQNLVLKTDKLFLLFVLSIYIILLVKSIALRDLFTANKNYYFMGVLLSLCVVAFSSRLNIDEFYKKYRVLCLVASWVVMVQGVYMAATGDLLAPIQLFPTTTAEQEQGLWIAASRASGFFTEPQMYAAFILPGIALALVKREAKVAAILICGILVSGSTYGIVIAGALLLSNMTMSRRKDAGYATFVVVTVLFVAVLMATQYTALFDPAIEKLLSTDVATNVRLANSPAVFYHMSLAEKIFGLNVGVDEFMRRNAFLMPWLYNYMEIQSDGSTYLSGMFGLGVVYGVVPMVLFFLLVVKYFLRGSNFQRNLAIIVMLHSLSATILFNGYFVFFFSLLLANQNSHNNNGVRGVFGHR